MERLAKGQNVLSILKHYKLLPSEQSVPELPPPVLQEVTAAVQAVLAGTLLTPQVRASLWRDVEHLNMDQVHDTANRWRVSMGLPAHTTCHASMGYAQQGAAAPQQHALLAVMSPGYQPAGAGAGGTVYMAPDNRDLNQTSYHGADSINSISSQLVHASDAALRGGDAAALPDAAMRALGHDSGHAGVQQAGGGNAAGLGTRPRERMPPSDARADERAWYEGWPAEGVRQEPSHGASQQQWRHAHVHAHADADADAGLGTHAPSAAARGSPRHVADRGHGLACNGAHDHHARDDARGRAADGGGPRCRGCSRSRSPSHRTSGGGRERGRERGREQYDLQPRSKLGNVANSSMQESEAYVDRLVRWLQGSAKGLDGYTYIQLHRYLDMYRSAYSTLHDPHTRRAEHAPVRAKCRSIAACVHANI